jgi:hypothetical protein
MATVIAVLNSIENKGRVVPAVFITLDKAHSVPI